MVEVPAFMASDAAFAAQLHQLHEAGNLLMIKGRPLQPLPAQVLALFSHSIVEMGEDRRTGEATPEAAGHAQDHHGAGRRTHQ